MPQGESIESPFGRREAIVFGDLDDPNSRASRLAGSGRAFRLLEDLGTKPKIVYLKPVDWGVPQAEGTAP